MLPLYSGSSTDILISFAVKRLPKCSGHFVYKPCFISHEQCVFEKSIFFFHQGPTQSQNRFPLIEPESPPPICWRIDFYEFHPSRHSRGFLIGTKLYLYARMRASSKAPGGIKDSECEKGSLGVRPPIPYVPHTDLLQTKDSLDNLKVKMSDGTVFTMSILTKGDPEDYLQHVQAVLRLINQKGLNEQCKKLQKELKEHGLP